MKIFVAGNGPSLKDIDFNDLKEIEWMGMNAAYRYWDTINIYPTYYCCLDTVVVKEHAENIVRLINEKKVKKAFLSNAILELYPDLEKNKNVYFVEEILNSSLGKHPIYQTKFSSKKTTGSWSIRFLISLGYDEIYISGIDCNYVEIVPGASLTGEGLELEIVDDTKENPNYFFDFYQKKGDLYQIPNPESHFGNMHLQSLEAIAHDVRELNLNIDIFNTAKESNLFKYNVFQYLSPHKCFSTPILQAVCIPMIEKELENLLGNFDLWDRVGFQPLSSHSQLLKKIDLHILLDCEKKQKLIDKIETKYQDTLYLKNMFHSLKITFLDIPSELNKYVRDKEKKRVFRKIGPNIHFFMSMEQCKEYEYIFFMETDCTPVKQNWMEHLNTYILGNSEVLIAGSLPTPFNENIDPAFGLHMNGNAIYATGSSKFQKLIKEVWLPSLLHLMTHYEDYHIAYDCVLSKVYSLGLSQRIQKNLGAVKDEEVSKLYLKLLDYSAFIHSCPHIVNFISSDKDYKLIYEIDKLSTTIVHNRDYNDLIIDMSKKSNSLDATKINATCKLEQWYKSKFLNVHSVFPSQKLYAYHNYNSRQDVKFEFLDYSRAFVILTKNEMRVDSKNINAGPTLVFESKDLKIGQKIKLNLKVAVDEDVDTIFKFARQFEGKYSQAINTVRLKKNEINQVSLILEIKDVYRALRLEFIPQQLISKMLVMYNFEEVLDSQIEYKNSCKIIPRKFQHNNIVKLFQHVLKHRTWQNMYSILDEKPKSVLPKVLILDFTLLGSNSATGQIKQTLFENWENDKIFQVYTHGNSLRGTYPKMKNAQVLEKNIMDEVEKFNFDIIYFRLADRKVLFNFYFEVQKELNKPVVTHMMDDWIDKLHNQGHDDYKYYAKSLKKVYETSDVNLSICDEMSEEYERRFGVKFTAIANGVDIKDFLPKNWSERALITKENPLIIRYMGGLATDMCLKSIQKFSMCISELSDIYPIELEIYTMDWYLDEARKIFDDIKSVNIFPLVDKAEYPNLLTSSDVLLVAYNFDDITLSYLGLSFANKLPEVLASGTPIIALGHQKIPTMSYFSKLDFVNTITNEDFNKADIETVLKQLFFTNFNKEYLDTIAKKSRAHVNKHLTKTVKTAIFEKSFNIKNGQESIVRKITLNKDSFKYANNCFKSGNYEEALEIYEMLYQNLGLNIYKMNADMARKNID